MRAGTNAGIAMVLFLGLSGCSQDGSLFSYDTAGPVRHATAESNSPQQNGSCAQIANQRADDAVMAGYVSDGSAGRAKIYDVTYRDCTSQLGF